jgi:universal stress protein E
MQGRGFAPKPAQPPVFGSRGDRLQEHARFCQRAEVFDPWSTVAYRRDQTPKALENKMRMEFRRVVVDVHDPNSEQQPTVEAAAAIVRRTGGQLMLFHNLHHRNFLDERGSGDELVAEARELLIESHQQQLEERAQGLRDEGLDVDCFIVWSGDGWLELTKFASNNSADLVVSVSRPHTRWERLTLSNEDWQLIRYNPTPLLLVKPGASKSYSHALAAVDPLHADDKPASLDHHILEAASFMCELHEADLKVINVVTPVLSAAPTVAEPLLATDTIAQEAATEAHVRRVTELTKEHQLDPVGIAVMVGEPAEEIVSYATENACDLLVMGAVSRSALGRLLIGNTAEKVLDAVPCDLLIVKPEDVGSESKSHGSEAA